MPYVAHLLAVTAITLEMGCSENDAIGALLHDVVEDRGGPAALEEIRVEFGADVARIVKANSDTDEEPKPPWPQRKQAYIDSIPHKEPDELRVSLADKLHNARAILLDYRTHGEDVVVTVQGGRGRVGALVLPCARRRLRGATRAVGSGRCARRRRAQTNGRRTRPPGCRLALVAASQLRSALSRSSTMGTPYRARSSST